METVIKTTINRSNSKTASLNWFEEKALLVEKYRFAAAPMMMIFQTCLGSIAAAYFVEQKDMMLLTVCVVLSMGANGAFLGQASAKACLGTFLASVILNVAFIVMAA